MTRPQRVLIIGSPGSGKSTAARRLGAVLGLPVVHMDREVFWLPGWVERDKPAQRAQIARIVAQEDWVFEGNNSATFSLRAARADLLIWLDVPLGLRLVRVIRRNLTQRGQARPDMAEGCTERLSMLPGFLWFVLSSARRSRAKQRAFYETTPLPKHRLTSVQAVNAFLENFK